MVRNRRLANRLPACDCELTALGAAAKCSFDRLGKLQDDLKRDGALWVVRPKGRTEITEEMT